MTSILYAKDEKNHQCINWCQGLVLNVASSYTTRGKRSTKCDLMMGIKKNLLFSGRRRNWGHACYFGIFLVPLSPFETYWKRPNEWNFFIFINLSREREKRRKERILFLSIFLRHPLNLRIDSLIPSRVTSRLTCIRKVSCFSLLNFAKLGFLLLLSTW